MLRLPPLNNWCMALCIGLFSTALWFGLTWHIGLNMADEGFYWYGAQRVWAGEVPILDFMAYDPGRYYIAAAVMAVAGNDGIWPARAAANLILAMQVSLGVYLALLVFNGGRLARFFYSATVAVLLIVWTYPYFRTFDFFASILLIFGLSEFIRERTSRGWFVAGLTVGIAAVLGRNHGVYGVAGHLLALAVIYYGQNPARPSGYAYLSWVLGVVAGYLPVIFLNIFVEGFPGAFIESVRFIIGRGSTNIILPVPWPWMVDTARLGSIWSMFYVGQGLFFIFLIAFPVAGFGYVAAKRIRGAPRGAGEDENAVFLAAVCLALPYAHYAFSRADVTHLASSILPLLLGLLSIPVASGWKPRILMALALLASGAFIMAGTQPALRYFALHEKLEAVQIGADKILVPPEQAENLKYLGHLVQAETGRGKPFLALPNYPTLHAIYRSKMAVWEIYPLVARDEAFEKQEIQRIEKLNPPLIIVSNHDPDHNESFRYKNIHPLIYRWLNSKYRREDHGKNLEIYRAADGVLR